MSRHLFFGANTPDGFYHCFGDILFLEEAQKIIYLKGSSGSGKSTLMKKVAAAFEKLGSEADYIHCSNNIGDLDGICVRDYGVCIVDATAPHVCDPSVPVAVDEILNLAEFIDEGYISGFATELTELGRAKKPYYEKAYRYLNAACTVYKNNRTIRQSLLDRGALNRLVGRELVALGSPPAKKPGKNRRMFASAVAPQGLTSYLGTMIEGYSVVRVESEDGAGGDELLERLQTTANVMGLSTETCYCPWDVSRPEHLFIPAMGVCYLTSHRFCSAIGDAGRVIDLNRLCDTEGLEQYGEELEYNTRMFDTLLKKSMEMMAAQKVIHDRVEKIYVPSMDFAAVNKRTEELIARLTSLPAKKA